MSKLPSGPGLDQGLKSREQDALIVLAHLLYLISVQPIYVPHLAADALLLLRYEVVLIDADLSAEAEDRVVDQTLTAAVDMLTDS